MKHGYARVSTENQNPPCNSPGELIGDGQRHEDVADLFKVGRTTFTGRSPRAPHVLSGPSEAPEERSTPPQRHLSCLGANEGPTLFHHFIRGHCRGMKAVPVPSPTITKPAQKRGDA